MKAFRAAAAIGAVVGALAAGGVGSNAQKPVTPSTVAAVQSWVNAVNGHDPGKVDGAVREVAAWTYDARVELNNGLPLFFKALLDRAAAGSHPGSREIVTLGRTAGGENFLKRAATLHADVAAYVDELTPVSPREAAAPAARTREMQLGQGAAPARIDNEGDTPPLLTRSSHVLVHDGQILGDEGASWNWPFARSLLDLVDAGPAAGWTPSVTIADDGRVVAKPGPRRDAFAAAWYHATIARMLAHGNYGDLTPHLHRAAEVFPDNALVLFDQGCYAEALGLPMYQTLLAASAASARAHEQTPRWLPSDRQSPLRIPPADRTNADAERYYRRAADADDTLAEARVRLGRLLQLRGRHNEAATELRRALTGHVPSAVAFYAHLFAGRAAETLGNDSDAAEHYVKALSLFPNAQSALLAASRLALARSDVAGALAPITQLGPLTAESDADPWWRYSMCAGRDADALLTAVWSQVPHAAPPPVGRN